LANSLLCDVGAAARAAYGHPQGYLDAWKAPNRTRCVVRALMAAILAMNYTANGSLVRRIRCATTARI
jgi:hypothetical protein